MNEEGNEEELENGEELEIEETEEDLREKEEKEPPIETNLWDGLSLLVKLFLAALLIPAIVCLFIGIWSRTYLGIGIISMGVFIYTLMKGFKAVPEMEEWIVELFKRYYRTWLPGLHFIIPIPFIMRIRSKITVGATKLVKLFMTEDDELEFSDDSAGLEVHIKVKATGSFGTTYRVMFTDEEIVAIEKAEITKNHDLLPEPWMYFAMAQVEAAVRGVCGGYGIDDAIKSVSYSGPAGKIKAEYEADAKIPKDAKKIANQELKNYQIKVEEILLRNIRLSKETEEKRRQIQLEAKQVLIEEQKLKQKIVQADQGRQEGLRVKRRLDAIIEGTLDQEGKETKSSGLTRGDAMKYEVALETAGSTGQINFLSGGGEKEPIPFDAAARLGASFGIGQQSVSKEPVERKKRKKINAEEETTEETEKIINEE